MFEFFVFILLSLKDQLYDLLHPGLRMWLADLEDCGVKVPNSEH